MSITSGTTSSIADPAENPTPAGGPSHACPTCSITTETVATLPPDRARHRIGVGEEVRCTFSLGNARWDHTGGGRLSSDSGTTVTYTAHDTPGSVRVTATGQGCTAQVDFQIVAPSSVHLEREGEVAHTRGYPDVGMNAFIYIRPDNVSFYNIMTRENDSQAHATGVYSCKDGLSHNPNMDADHCTTTVVEGKGTVSETVDEIDSGYCATAPPNPSGTEHIAIDCAYNVPPSSRFWGFDTVHQRATCEPSGRLSATKADAVAETTVDAETFRPSGW